MARAAGLNIEDLIEVIRTGEGDFDAAAAQFEGLTGAADLFVLRVWLPGASGVAADPFDVASSNA